MHDDMRKELIFSMLSIRGASIHPAGAGPCRHPDDTNCPHRQVRFECRRLLGNGGNDPVRVVTLSTADVDSCTTCGILGLTEKHKTSVDNLAAAYEAANMPKANIWTHMKQRVGKPGATLHLESVSLPNGEQRFVKVCYVVFQMNKSSGGWGCNSFLGTTGWKKFKEWRGGTGEGGCSELGVEGCNEAVPRSPGRGREDECHLVDFEFDARLAFRL